MRLATFNVQNLFRRHPALDDGSRADDQSTAEQIQELNKLFEREAYSEDDKGKMLVLLSALDLLGRHSSGRTCRLRVNRGKLVDKHRIIANGRDDWVGWVEQKLTLVEQLPIRMTARVIHELQADILAVQEVENRNALREFNASYLRLDNKSGQATHRTKNSSPRFDQIMVIDGNDERGINVGLMARPGYTMSYVRSHAHMGHLSGGGGQVFSRDCAEYLIITPEKQQVWILNNHFKSKRGGGDAKRHEQAMAVRSIYERLKANRAHIAIVGDLNDLPGSTALAPLLGDGCDLKSAYDHKKFTKNGPGTFGDCTDKEQFDYILLSPALFDKVQAGGINRNGLWGGKSPGSWPRFEEITSKAQSASDHAALWVDLDLA